MKYSKWKRAIALITALALSLSLMSVGAFAQEDGTEAEETAEAVETVETTEETEKAAETEAAEETADSEVREAAEEAAA